MNLATVIHLFGNVQGTMFVGMDTETVPKLNKFLKDPVTGKPDRDSPNPHYGRVTKRTTGISARCAGNVKSNTYENSINKTLMAEGKEPTFKVGERAWGDKETGTALVFHDNGEVYVHFDDIQSVGNVQWLLDGNPIDKKDVLGYSEPKFNPNGQGGISEANREVPRSYKLSSIIAVRYNGQEWR